MRLGPKRPIVMIAGEPPYLLDGIDYLTDPACAGCFDPIQCTLRKGWPASSPIFASGVPSYCGQLAGTNGPFCSISEGQFVNSRRGLPPATKRLLDTSAAPDLKGDSND